MITCNLMGGLGNQIFQIFATISYAIKSRNQFKFLNLKTLGGGSTTIRYTFWETFFSNLKPFLISIIPHVNIIREKNFTYNELPINEMIDTNVMISGYFQSYKYFEENYSMIYRILNIDKMKVDLLNTINLDTNLNDNNISVYFINSCYLDNTISMHFRIGDYKKIQNVHPLATYNFYESSLTHLKNCNPDNKFNVLYFCEDPDIIDVMKIVDELIDKFPMYIFTRGTNRLEDWQQMLLMSCCHHNIIANSSFSWWSAYLNSHSDKIVCYPSVWFGESVNNDTIDLCPPDWVRIQV